MLLLTGDISMSHTDAREIGHYIGGHHWKPAKREKQDVYNPATGQVSAQVILADASDVASVVEAAKAASAPWAETSALRRARVVFKFRELVEKHHDDLAAAITREHGKIFSDAYGEVTRGLE